MNPAVESAARRGGLVVTAASIVGLLLISGCSVSISRTGVLGHARGGGAAAGGVANAEAPLQADPLQGSSTQSLNLQEIANTVDPAVVDINTVLDSQGQQAQAAGTGMILTSSGEVLTNHHVVEGASSIQVTIQGRTNSYDATVIGVAPLSDVALIQIQGASSLPTVTLADSSGLAVGQAVVALGNALGRGGTPSETQGMITALNQSITATDNSGNSENLTGLIQSNAPISPGDSGGPLVNGAGQVVGMVTAGSAGRFRQAAASRVGFAIPSSAALEVVNQIRSGQGGPNIILGRAGFLGVGAQDLNPQTASRLGLNVSSGALIQNVVSGSPAAQAGISPGSVITAINGQTITSTNEMGLAIHVHKPGTQIKVTWVDQRGSHTATVTLMSGPVA